MAEVARTIFTPVAEKIQQQIERFQEKNRSIIQITGIALGALAAACSVAVGGAHLSLAAAHTVRAFLGDGAGLFTLFSILGGSAFFIYGVSLEMDRQWTILSPGGEANQSTQS